MTGGKTPQTTRLASPRRLARLAAVQALYQLDVNGGEPSRVILEFLQHRLSEVVESLDLTQLDRQLFNDLVAGVARDRDELTQMVAPALVEGWPLERLEVLLRLILCCGTFELWQCPDVPARAVISEYLEVTHAFFDGKEPSFVNGVLNRLAHSLREEEFGAAAGEGQ